MRRSEDRGAAVDAAILSPLIQAGVEPVRGIIEALNRGDLDGMLARMHPDFEWRPLEASLAVVPSAQAAIFDRFRFVDDPYSDDTTICGIDVQIEGTATGFGQVRTGKGKQASAFFEHVNFAYSETWTATNGRFVTVTGNANSNEVKAVPLGGNVFRFTSIESGQPFRLYDSQGHLLLRDRGVIRFTFDFDTLGDGTPGGEPVQELEPSVRGPHPGFSDEGLCPVLVPLLSGP